MTVRNSMTELIAHLRTLTDDPSGTEAMFTDQQMQDVLDQSANIANYEQLCPVENITTAGVIEYKRYISPVGYWETDFDLRAGDYSQLTPSGSACFQGSWTFAVSTDPPVVISGTWYDVWGAAAEVWEMKAAAYANEFDFNVDGGDYKVSQKHANALFQAERCRRKSTQSNKMTTLTRTDVISD